VSSIATRPRRCTTCSRRPLVVSHDARAARIADRIIRIRDGRLSEEWRPGDGTPAVESLVVDSRGWLRLPEPLRRRVGVVDRAHATLDGDAIRLTTTTTTADLPRDHAPAAANGDQLATVAPRSRETSPVSVGELDGIVVDRDGRRILDGVSLHLAAGALTTVSGRSGSGKTTLLRVLCGLERPDAGTVRVSGEDLAGLDRSGLAALRRRHVGVAGQGTALLETMDVAENLDLARVARHLPADPDHIHALVEALGLTALRHRPVRALSGGERQRVAVGRVLAVSPALAVFDEPTSHQDEAHAELVVAALVAAADRGVAVVAATHDPLLTAAATVSRALT
jgi:ABC-type lipoprotein export system ATPase subunit